AEGLACLVGDTRHGVAVVDSVEAAVTGEGVVAGVADEDVVAVATGCVLDVDDDVGADLGAGGVANRCVGGKAVGGEDAFDGVGQGRAAGAILGPQVYRDARGGGGEGDGVALGAAIVVVVAAAR